MEFGVLDVEQIAHLGSAIAASKDRDTGGAAANSSVKAPLPLGELQHCNGIGALVMNQKLILKGIAVVPSGALQKAEPVFRGGSYGFERLPV